MDLIRGPTDGVHVTGPSKLFGALDGILLAWWSVSRRVVQSYEEALAIALGLIRTSRAVGRGCRDHGLEALKVPRLLRGKIYGEAEELQPSFGEAMEKAGRRKSFRSLGPRPMGSACPAG